MLPAVYGGAAACKDLPSPPIHPRIVAIGNFDGVHLGHQAVLTMARAQAPSLPLSVYTFDPAPTALLAPLRHQPRIGSLWDRIEWLEGWCDEVIVEPFTSEFAAISAEVFIKELLVKRLAARVVVVGYDFCFGAKRSGNGDTLKNIGTPLGLQVVQVGPLALDEANPENTVVSSSKIRKLVLEGKVAEAARMLGRPHRLKGLVGHGEKRGRTIGFPTANLVDLPNSPMELLPAFGVYAGWAGLESGEKQPAVANIGMRPTVSGSHRTLEVHLLDFSRDLYGSTLSFELVARLRGEQKFESLQALKNQIQQDTTQARAILLSQ
jgi:riboflavin kinase/FMN adenylyltransferase